MVHYIDERRHLGVGDRHRALQKRGERCLGREDRSILGPLGLILGAPLGLAGITAALLPYLVLRLILLLGRPSTYRIALTKLLGGIALFGAWFALLTWATLELAGFWPALGLGLALPPLTVFAHRYAIDLRLYRFGLRSNLKRLRERRRFARMSHTRRRLTRELTVLRTQYLAQSEQSA